MRAVIFRRHTPALDAYSVSDELAAPAPGPGEVLVRVRYAALNRLDDWVRCGWRGLHLDFPHVPCSDFSGVIAGVGDGVVEWRVGQAVTANPFIWCDRCPACLHGEFNRCHNMRLLGENVRGVCAEYAVVPVRNLALIPDGYDMQKAAAASLVYVTAWHSLMVAGDLRAAERVLVVGAGGGVNSASIQIAKLAGCTVFVIASSEERAERARQQGADFVHDRSDDPNWSQAIYLATGKQGVDLVVDNVGQATWPSSLRTLRPGGRLVTVGGTTGYDAQVSVNLIFARHLSIIGSTMGTQADYNTVMELVFAGALKPVVDSVFGMKRFVEAMTHMVDNRHFGKILIDIDG